MGEDPLKTRGNRGFGNRTQVTRRQRSVAECEVTLRADKRRALISLIDLVIENPTISEGRGNVTTFSTTTRFHRHLVRCVIGGVHPCDVVTLCAFHVLVRFMSKRTC